VKAPSGIYVEVEIQDDLAHVWLLIQDPALHQRWDLRFSRIHYLPDPVSLNLNNFCTRRGSASVSASMGLARAPVNARLPAAIPRLLSNSPPPIRNRSSARGPDTGATFRRTAACAFLLGTTTRCALA